MSERLQRLLGGDELRWLRERLRDGYERGAVPTSVSLREPTEAQRRAVADLLGRRLRPGASLTVRIADVEGVLRHSAAAADLPAALEQLDGPLRDRRAERTAQQLRWAGVLGQLDGLIAGRPELVPWQARVAGGLLRRLAPDPADADRLLGAACAVVTALPADEVPRGVLARSVTGDAHALDDDRPLSTLVLAAVAALSGTDPAGGAEARRAAWLSVGVLTGDVTAPVLTLALPGDSGTACGRALALWREAGQPVHLSLRQLEREPPRWDLRGNTVFVCENPVVVAAAADVSASRPLVCLGGQPAGAARLLLRRLTEAGAQLAVHADFDWGGVVIASGVLRRAGGRPWRFDAASYRAARSRGATGGALSGRPADTPWDPRLRNALLEERVRVEEEAVLDDLLHDLS